MSNLDVELEFSVEMSKCKVKKGILTCYAAKI